MDGNDQTELALAASLDAGRGVARGGSLEILLVALSLAAGWVPLEAQEAGLPDYLADRGRGIAMSRFGTYVERGELLVYPFYEYTRTTGFEYHASELGDVGSEDHLGRLIEHEALLYLAYGISDRLAIELEGALHASSTFDKAPDDPSGLPDTLEESGLGDVEGQVRWRWREETARRPELYSFLEVVFPLQRDELLLGTQHWEGALGFGVIRGHRWGTLNARVTAAYDGEDSRVEVGEYGIEYLKRTSPGWRFVAALEGESEEVSLIGEVQRFFGRRAILKLNCGFGLVEKAPDIAPEIGLAFRFGARDGGHG